jgi:hypothetical protein
LALTDLVGSLGVQLEMGTVASIEPRVVLFPQPSDDPPLARVWIDLTPSNRAIVYLVDRPWERVLVRFVPRQPGKQQLLTEQVAQIVALAVEGLLAGGTIGISRAAARRELLGSETPTQKPNPTPQKPPVPAEPRKSRVIADQKKAQNSVRWFLGVFYAGELYANRYPFAHGPGVWVALDGEGGTPRPSALGLAALGAVQYRHISIDAQPVGAEFDIFSARVSFGAWMALSPKLRALFAAGGGVDLSGLRPTGNRTTTLEKNRWLAYPVARALAGARYSVARDLALAGFLSLDLELFHSRFVYEQNGTRFTALEPWRARPGLELGILFP